jgi:DNA-binding HxlR family transcriptional regulator
MDYGQFCPIAKASELIGEKWTILIIRELLMGGTRFTDLQRGLGTISPTLLTRRLQELESRGLLIRKRIQGQRGYEYLPTPSCQELLPLLVSLGEWGMRWARANLTDKDYDVGLLLLYLQRSIDPAKLPGRETVIRFHFTDLKDAADWWLLIEDADVEVCYKDPGRDVDIFFTTSVRVIADVWMGDVSYREAIDSGALSIIGPAALIRDVGAWINSSVFADLPAASRIR